MTKKIYSKLKNYTLQDAFEIEKSDRQFLALEKLWFSKNLNKEEFLSLILSNSIICYQLSSTGENYWEEFSKYFSRYGSDFNDITSELEKFIRQSKWNRRLLEIKIKRLWKLKKFLKIFEEKIEYYYENMDTFRNDLASVMNQKNTAKTIVFAVKMFSYGCRIAFSKLIKFPEEINIPIDSRLEKIFDFYKDDNDKNISDFYKKLSEKLEIPQLHLDAILWVNYEELVRDWPPPSPLLSKEGGVEFDLYI